MTGNQLLGFAFIGGGMALIVSGILGLTVLKGK
jgi:hypothetical protein